MTIDDALEHVRLAGWELLSLVNQTLTQPDYLVFLKRKISFSEYRNASGRGPTPAIAILEALKTVTPKFPPPAQMISFADFMAGVAQKEKDPGESPGK